MSERGFFFMTNIYGFGPVPGKLKCVILGPVD